MRRGDRLGRNRREEGGRGEWKERRMGRKIGWEGEKRNRRKEEYSIGYNNI